ncbi:MAG: hybrid sensor histidine kinase/response regulator transcription factor [Phocaeicola sp.]
MLPYRYLLIPLLSLLITYVGYGATPSSITDVKHLTYSEGLSSHRVFTIIEDANQAVWISTKSGVDRYNGREIKNYTLTGDFYYGDMAGRMIQLYQDADGEIWAYDNTGRIYCYSKVYDRFELTFKISNCVSGNIMLNKYFRSRSGKEIFGLTEGLCVVNNQELELFVRDIDVNDVVEIGETLFVGTTCGLSVVNPATAAWPVLLLEDKSIQTLYHDMEKNSLFIGTFNDGLWVMDLATYQVSQIGLKGGVFTNPIRSIVSLDSATLAIGIDGSGVYTFDYGSKSSHLLINCEDCNPHYLHGNGIYTMALDGQANLWVGSYTGGASLVSLTESPSKLIVHEKGTYNTLANNNVNGVVENVNGDIWYATDRGASIFQTACGTWRHSLEGSVGVALCPTGDGNMLLGTYGDGIYFLDQNGKVIKRLNKQLGSLTSNTIFSIKRDEKGSFWVGALDGELMNLDATGQLIASYPISLVLSITVIDADRIAAATVNGFYIVDSKHQTVEHYASAQEQISHNVSAYIVPMLFNNDGTVWLGTEGGGLNLYNLTSREIVHSYKVSDGLPSNDVYSLQRDSLGRIWVSTGSGIAVIEDSIVSSLNYLAGVEKEYNKSASIVLSDGGLLFGGTTGAVKFLPSEINRVAYKAPLRITGFVIDGISEEKRERLMPYIYHGLQAATIQLPHNQNYLTIHFESINLRYQEDIAYRYILEGYDNDWSEHLASGVATYKNVTPGSYLLRLCSVRKCDGKVIDQQTIKIVISLPWWRSWWAFLIYALLIALVVYFMVRYKWYQLQKRHDEDKIRFFINTAHDIRTPVTLAMAPLEDIEKSEQLSSHGSYLLHVARQNIRKLNSITSQLLEFEKIDAGKHLLNLEVIDLCDILREEVSCFQNVCQKKHLELLLELPDTPICMLGDTHLVEMVFDNLLSNACKYTPSGGSVKVVVVATKSKIRVQIMDTGIGIPTEERKHIFSDIYRAKNARESQETGTGFGLLQVKRIVKMLRGGIDFSSVEGEGSLFTVSFERVYSEAIAHSTKRTVRNSLDEILPATVQQREVQTTDKEITLLLVEDNDDLRHYLVKTFLPDYNVIERSTADDALSYLSTEYPDLIISDVMMPGMQGDDFCRVVKNNPETSGIPVILLTAKTNHESVVNGLQKGADDYVAKPFSTEILKLKVRGLIENRNRLRTYLLKQAVNQVVLDKSGELLTASIEESEEPNLSASDREFMEKVTNLIISNLADTEFTIDTLCREMAMSRTLFYSRLKSLTGKAPQEFIRILRLERASDLLQQGVSVTEVAEATGFINVKYFSTIFKKQFGIPPSKFAEERVAHLSAK